jgi:hypothetical protein
VLVCPTAEAEVEKTEAKRVISIKYFIKIPLCVSYEKYISICVPIDVWLGL